MDIWDVSTFWVLWIMILCTFMYTMDRFSIFLVINLGIELLGHMVILGLNFLSNGQVVFQSSCPILYSYQQCMRVTIAPHFTNTMFLSVTAILVNMKGYPIAILICISLVDLCTYPLKKKKTWKCKDQCFHTFILGIHTNEFILSF